MGKLVFIKIVIVLFWLCPTLLSSQHYISYHIGEALDTVVAIEPAILLAGGGKDNDDAMRWMLSKAKGGDVLILRASGKDGYNEYLYKDLDVPVHSVETILFLDRTASDDPAIIDKINHAEIIFIAGGDQTKYFDLWHDTAVGAILNDICKNKTKVIGGTSAGMMILGNIFYAPLTDGVKSAQALANPYHPNLLNIQVNTFIQNPLFTNCIFDSHFDNRHREGRLMVFLAKIATEHNIKSRAIACNESTAIGIDNKNIATIFGNAPSSPDIVYFMEVQDNEHYNPPILIENQNVNWHNNDHKMVKVQKLFGSKDFISTFDMSTWESLSQKNIEYWEIVNGELIKHIY